MSSVKYNRATLKSASALIHQHMQKQPNMKLVELCGDDPFNQKYLNRLLLEFVYFRFKLFSLLGQVIDERLELCCPLGATLKLDMQC